jgi:biotin operon repressor
MSDDTPHKAFRRARLQAMDNLRRNGKLSATARIVGLEILACVNSVSGGAWPSETRIADRLGIGERTVRRAVKQLKAAGCTKVMRRRGRSNVYFPAFADRTEANLAGVEADPREANLASNPGQKRPHTPDKNGRLTPSSNPGRTPSTKAAAEEGKIAQRNKHKARQKAENEIADLIGWHCTTEIPREEFEDLCRRWPDVEAAELFELKEKYKPPAAVGGRRARAAGGA